MKSYEAENSAAKMDATARAFAQVNEARYATAGTKEYTAYLAKLDEINAQVVAMLNAKRGQQ